MSSNTNKVTDSKDRVITGRNMERCNEERICFVTDLVSDMAFTSFNEFLKIVSYYFETLDN